MFSVDVGKISEVLVIVRDSIIDLHLNRQKV